MAHGTPDWGVTAGGRTVYQMTDLAEHAVRLGSPVSYDRRGDVLWLDDFRSGLAKFVTVTQGEDSVVDLSTARARNGHFSARLVAGSDGNRLARLQKRVPLPVLSVLGLEYSFSLASTIEFLRTYIVVLTGSQEQDFEFRWRDTDDDLQYRDANDAWQTFATGVALHQHATLFHSLKLVFDPFDIEYVRLHLGPTVYSLKGFTAQRYGSDAVPRLDFFIEMGGREGYNDTVYLDDLILTQNEPT